MYGHIWDTLLNAEIFWHRVYVGRQFERKEFLRGRQLGMLVGYLRRLPVVSHPSRFTPIFSGRFTPNILLIILFYF